MIFQLVYKCNCYLTQEWSNELNFFFFICFENLVELKKELEIILSNYKLIKIYINDIIWTRFPSLLLILLGALLSQPAWDPFLCSDLYYGWI